MYLYLILWLLTALIFYRKGKRIYLGYFLIFLYVLSALSSVLLLEVDSYSFNRLVLAPIIIQYILILLLSGTVFRLDEMRLEGIERPPSQMLNLLAWLFIIFSFITLKDLVPSLGEKFGLLFNSDSGAQDLYETALVQGEEQNDGQISNLPAIISSAMSGFAIFMWVFIMALPRRNKVMHRLLFVSIVIITIPSLLSGQRNGIIETVIIFVGTVLMFRKFFDVKTLKRMRSLFSLVVGLLMFPLFIITASRFGDRVGVYDSLLFYAGQANLNFNSFALDNNGLRYGDRIVPFYKKLLGFQNVPNSFWETREKYENLSINDEVFIGSVGDLLLDFGLVWTTLLIWLIYRWTANKTRIKNGTLRFDQMILIHALFYACAIGSFKLFPFAGISGNLKLSVYILTYYLFRLAPKNTRSYEQH